LSDCALGVFLTTCDRDIEAALGSAISERIGEPRYQLWFQPNTKFSCRENGLVIGVPNHFYQDWLQTTFGEAVQEAAAHVFARPLPIRFTIDPQLFQSSREAQAAALAPQDVQPAEPMDLPAIHAVKSAPEAEPAAPRPLRQRQWRQLADFVVGSCNRVAHAAALHAFEAPHETPSPLVLHGPVGTGKTHLLEGIYSGLRKSHADWRVTQVRAEDFTNRFVQAMRQSKLSGFRHQFRCLDALLIDDLQFLATKPATQEEFLHTLDALAGAGALVVATMDCHPRLIEEFTPELADRLVAGVVWSIGEPDPHTRLEILRAKSAKSECLVPDGVLRLLAERLPGNVRQLEGAIHSVRHMARVNGRPVDLHLAQETLGALLRDVIRTYRLDDIEAAVCKALALESGALRTKKRAWSVSHPRMLAMYLGRRHTAATYGEIGRYFGGRNHSTALAADKKVRSWLEKRTEIVIGERRLAARQALELAERELSR
jgi:chromosomal replication initiator protein